MNRIPRTLAACVAVALVGVAAASTSPKRLTIQRVIELTAPTDAPSPPRYKIEVSDLGSVVLSANKPEGQVGNTRDVFFPTAFNPPQAGPAGSSMPLVPSTPTAFDKINVGWTVRLSAKPQGKLLAIFGVADYVEADLVPGGYGVLAGPIFVDQGGGVLTQNIITEPKSQTTTTRFQLFALPGESYEVIFYRGGKTEKRRLTVSAEP